ncbi:MAG: DsrE family protein [Schleiferiaceae bacterium]|jgi:intracellular sulfur oxidation DsrE/DsrF family protein|nr:MAG: Uncharacterised protein [Cryomorphaceae bacterium]
MKKIILSLVIAAGALLSACNAPAQEAVTEAKPAEEITNNYFVLNRNVQQLKAIGKAAGELATADAATYGEFNVVICGKAVKDLATAETMVPFMDILNANNVNVIACGFSLKKFEVDTALLPQGVTVVPNGILYGFELQKDGYYSITL